jgi:hypothetical protein
MYRTQISIHKKVCVMISRDNKYYKISTQKSRDLWMMIYKVHPKNNFITTLYLYE